MDLEPLASPPRGRPVTRRPPLCPRCPGRPPTTTTRGCEDSREQLVLKDQPAPSGWARTAWVGTAARIPGSGREAGVQHRGQRPAGQGLGSHSQAGPKLGARAGLEAPVDATPACVSSQETRAVPLGAGLLHVSSPAPRTRGPWEEGAGLVAPSPHHPRPLGPQGRSPSSLDSRSPRARVGDAGPRREQHTPCAPRQPALPLQRGPNPYI